jgi:hypothetical protein
LRSAVSAEDEDRECIQVEANTLQGSPNPASTLERFTAASPKLPAGIVVV